MAHFAQLDEANIVINVIVVNNQTIEELPFPQSEPIGVAFCKSLFGADTNWKQTSYNSSFRINYAGVGFTFDDMVPPNGVFIPPQPFPSWVLDTSTYNWVSPITYPNDGNMYSWDETAQSWILLSNAS
jgi:hypothetical protein